MPRVPRVPLAPNPSPCLVLSSQLAASLRTIRSTDTGSRSCDSRCDSDSDVMAEAEVQNAMAAWESHAGGRDDQRTGSASGTDDGNGAGSSHLGPSLSAPSAASSSSSIAGGAMAGVVPQSRKKRQL